MLVGDSAGGNFSITSAMKLKQLGIRQPTAVLSLYPSINLTSGISPSRISSIVDPILPLGVLIACQHVSLAHCVMVLPSHSVYVGNWLRNLNCKKIISGKQFT